MTQVDALRLARHHLRENGLEQVDVRFNRSRVSLGRATSMGKLPVELHLSLYWLAVLPADEVLDTILHEIAHLLTPGDKHGPKWRAACRKVGAKPERFASREVSALAVQFDKYRNVCRTCGEQTGTSNRARTRKYVHRGCGGTVVQVSTT